MPVDPTKLREWAQRANAPMIDPDDFPMLARATPMLIEELVYERGSALIYKVMLGQALHALERAGVKNFAFPDITEASAKEQARRELGLV